MKKWLARRPKSGVPPSVERLSRTLSPRVLWLLVGLVFLVSVSPGRAEPARLCVFPPGLPFEEGDDRFGILEDLIGARFEQAGFELVASGEVRPILHRVNEESGLIYDPYDGRVIPEAFSDYKAALTNALSAELRCQGRLLLSIAVVRAPFGDLGAYWDGRRVAVHSPGLSVLKMLGGMSESGWVKATSLWIEMQSIEGDLVGFRSAGIEPLVSMSLSRDTDQLPVDRWLRNEANLFEAVELALGRAAERMRDQGRSDGPIDGARVGWPDFPIGRDL